MSNDWLNFIRAQLEIYGLQFVDLSDSTVYTFLGTRRELTPAHQDALYLVSEYNRDGPVRESLLVPRVEQITLSVDKLLIQGHV